jgi:cytochrome bd-type quinol oxidase subunit 2
VLALFGGVGMIGFLLLLLGGKARQWAFSFSCLLENLVIALTNSPIFPTTPITSRPPH